jgi:hypothetical protein
VAHAILAALWLIGLYVAAPLLRGAAPEYRMADRLRDAILLGVALPLLLGAVHLLYSVILFVALAACIVFAALRGARITMPFGGPPPYLTVCALLAVAWPALMRPILDGDSLSYHLPNAAAWVQANSLWTSATRYWWYPPASELFASGVYATGGPFALPWCGLCAMLLLATRVAQWTRESLGHWGADALTAALVTAYPLAIAAGTLQNDVWLAAFFVESLWTLRQADRAAAMRTMAATVLLKPQGWIVAVIAMLTSRAPWRVWLAAGIAIGAWALHDLLVFHGALIAPEQSAAYAHPFSTTIVANAPQALWLLARVTASISPFALLAMIAAFCGPMLPGNARSLGWAACASLLLFLVLPFGYETNVPQLATGESLRFAAPAMAVGTIVLARWLLRIETVATCIFAASAVFGIWRVLAVFWNDGSTHAAIPLALVGVAMVALAYRQRAAWPALAAAFAGIVLSTHLAARHPVDYYDDALSVNGRPPGIYRFIVAERPRAIGGVGLRLGVINVLSPGTYTRDLLDEDACNVARRLNLQLVAVAQNDLPPPINEARLGAARACVPTVYSDAIGVASASRALRETNARRNTARVF